MAPATSNGRHGRHGSSRRERLNSDRGTSALQRLQTEVDTIRTALGEAAEEVRRLAQVEALRPLQGEEAGRARAIRLEYERLRLELVRLRAEYIRVSNGDTSPGR